MPPPVDPRTNDSPAGSEPRVASWRRGEVLGYGAGGSVVAVRHVDTGVEGALKRARSGDTMAAERMRVESEVLGRVTHPRLVRVLDHGEDADGPWIVLERLGSSAAAGIARGEALTRADLARLGDDLLAALEALHAEGVLHRDIKPGNVLRDAHGGWKLADLGTARHGDSSLTATGTALGTPAYMAPEQRYGARSVGPAADLYAVGATLWATARGETPFELHAAGSEAWDGLPHGVWEVLHRATRLAPEARWASATAMRAAWTGAVRTGSRAIIATQPLHDEDEDTGDVSSAEASRDGEHAPDRVGRRGWIALTTSGVVVALAAATWTINERQHEAQARTVPSALPPVVRNLGPREGARFGATLTTGVDVGGGSAEDIAIGMPGEDVGGAVAVRFDGCCDVGTATVLTETPGLAFGTAVALIARTVGAARGGIVVGGPDGEGFRDDVVPGSGQVFVKRDYEAHYGRVLQRAFARPHGEAGTAVAAWWEPPVVSPPSTEGALRVAFGAPGVGSGARADRAGTAVLVTFSKTPDDLTYGDVRAVVGEAAQEAVGTAIVHADLDGDGVQELVVGAPGADRGAGCVRAFRTDETPGEVSFSTGLLLGCGEIGEAYGRALANAGDTDGDGRDEVWIGAPDGDGRVVRVDLTGIRATLHGNLPGSRFGAVLTARPDLSGSLWVGAPAAHGDAGHVWVYTGLGDGDHDAGEAVLEALGSAPGGAFGAAIAAQRDLVGGVRTFVGAPGELNGTGRVWEVGVGALWPRVPSHHTLPSPSEPSP